MWMWTVYGYRFVPAFTPMEVVPPMPIFPIY